MRNQQTHQWIWKDTTPEQTPRILKRMVAGFAGTVVVATLVLPVLFAVLFFRADWNGTPFQVTNSCNTQIRIDNGSDGFQLEPGESIVIPGFGGDLDLRIGAPGRPLEGTQTFESSPVDIAGRLCPQ